MQNAKEYDTLIGQNVTQNADCLLPFICLILFLACVEDNRYLCPIIMGISWQRIR